MDKNRIRKILSARFSERVLAIFAVLVLLTALLPLYRLTVYAIPRYDDFSYGKLLWQMQRYGIGPGTAIRAGVQTALSFRYSWQGTYASIFMMAQMPAAYGYEYYFLGPALLITSLALGGFFLSLVLCRKLLGAKGSEATLFSAIVTLALVELIYTAQQGFYWYNSGVHYTFMHSLMFVMTALAVLLAGAKHLWAKALLMLAVSGLAFACAGANYVTCLQGLLVLAGWMVCVAIRRKRTALWYVVPLIVYLFGFYLNVTAPGNQNRMVWYTGYGPVKSILWSYRAAWENLALFTGPYMLLFGALAVPVIWKMVRRMEWNFRLPGLFLLLTFSLYATGFTSSFYSMGNSGLARAWIAVKLTYQVLFFATECYFLGYLAHHERIPGFLRKCRPAAPEHFVWYYGVIIAAFLLVFAKAAPSDKIGNVSSWGAFYYVHSGEAYNFHQEFLGRVEDIVSSPEPEVGVQEYAYKPWFLINRDIGEDPATEENRMMAEYFGKQAIYLIPRH